MTVYKNDVYMFTHLFYHNCFLGCNTFYDSIYFLEKKKQKEETEHQEEE